MEGPNPNEASLLASSMEKILLMRQQIQSLASTMNSVLTTLEANGMLAEPTNTARMRASGTAEVTREEVESE